jgi:KUP system potassium uptake protein
MSKTKKGLGVLILGALGVVFGDIGTSPLYALPAVFGSAGHHLAVSKDNIHGVISLVIWLVTIIVLVKYIGFVMRADNKGEGGILALTALIKGSKLKPQYAGFFVFLGLIGVALFYGDSAITPAISVLSAVEGLGVVRPSLTSYVLPITIVVLAMLFWIQRYGTKLIGKLFGPVMLLWFITIAAGGLGQIWQHPDILHALSPLAAVNFFAKQPLAAFIAMSAVLLAVTGVEALYADMGHFGRGPIARAWLLFVFPALILCYMGQGALLLSNSSAMSSPLFLMYPEQLRFTVVLIATFATLIASQSVISGAFSLTRQAVHLGFLPKMIIKHTSKREVGQVYLPFVNLALFVVVVLLVLIFGTSHKLAGAFGMAVSITLAIDTILFIVVARVLWRKSLLYVIAILVGFLAVDILFVTSSFTKLFRGGWFPLALALLILVIMTTWIKGQRIISHKRIAQEESLQQFVDDLHANKTVRRIPGAGIYIGHTELTPLALQETLEKLHELHEKVVVVSVDISGESHIPEQERVRLDTLKYNDGITYLDIKYGFHDSPNIPKALAASRGLSPELDINLDAAEYFISHTKIVQTKRNNMVGWRKALYMLMARNALSSSDYFKLPTDRTIEMSTLVEL